MQQQKANVRANKFAADKRKKKKSAVKVVWVLMFLAIVFVVIIVRFALSGDIEGDIFSGMPTQDAVYDMAKTFVRPTLKGYGANFADGFEYGKQQDSVYVIKSTVETKDNSGEVQKTNFEINLRYKGGSVSSRDNWEVLNLNED